MSGRSSRFVDEKKRRSYFKKLKLEIFKAVPAFHSMVSSLASLPLLFLIPFLVLALALALVLALAGAGMLRWRWCWH